VDVGGSGIKGAIVDTGTGELITDRHRIVTPAPATPEKVTGVVQELIHHFEWKEVMGCGFPCVVHRGVSYSAANIHKSWIGINIEDLFTEATGCRTVVINDADAAGLAEMRFGAGADMQRGVVLVLTVGTGIGTAIFSDCHLVPNTELGHLEMDGKDAERRVSDAIRQKKKMTWSEWGTKFDAYLKLIDRLFFPDLIIVGGGISKEFDDFSPFLTVHTRVVPAKLRNLAGIIGAAMAVEERGINHPNHPA
jgi:polyphosphate glucokinase